MYSCWWWMIVCVGATWCKATTTNPYRKLATMSLQIKILLSHGNEVFENQYYFLWHVSHEHFFLDIGSGPLIVAHAYGFYGTFQTTLRLQKLHPARDMECINLGLQPNLKWQAVSTLFFAPPQRVKRQTTPLWWSIIQCSHL